MKLSMRSGPIIRLDGEEREAWFKRGGREEYGVAGCHMVLYWEPHGEFDKATGSSDIRQSFTLDIEIPGVPSIPGINRRYRFDYLIEADALWSVWKERIAVEIAKRALRLN